MAKIIVVDDSTFSRHRVVEVLTHAGHLAVQAADGQQGLDAVDVYQPDCIILDMLMPVVDGKEFLKRLRAGGSEVPVIVLTADIQSGTRSECEQLGISGYLNKPSEPEEILESVKNALLQTQGASQ